VAVRARETGLTEVCYGIPSGGGLTVVGEKAIAHGFPAQVFEASKGKPAKALDDLPSG